VAAAAAGHVSPPQVQFLLPLMQSSLLDFTEPLNFVEVWLRFRCQPL
jgi:hypothetical protein